MIKLIHSRAFGVIKIVLHACWSKQQQVHVDDALTGLSMWEMRVCGAGCCGKWKNENSVYQRLGPWSQVVKMGHTSPLPIGDDSISGMEAPIASQMQCVMLCKVVTISSVS